MGFFFLDHHMPTPVKVAPPFSTIKPAPYYTVDTFRGRPVVVMQNIFVVQEFSRKELAQSFADEMNFRLSPSI